MTKKVLVLGAGFVARPLVEYLLENAGVNLTVASRTLGKAENLIKNHPNGKAIELNADDENATKKLIEKSDIVISLLPWTYHLKVARLCLEEKKHLVTTSYVKPEMAALDTDARQKGLIFLNEIGVDPGIDHMAAMKIINRVKKNGGEITSFYSYCGGLPALEHNNNPLGYKFSWSPKGVMLAAANDGKYLKNGEIINIPGKDLFKHYWLIDIPGAGVFEAYVNRDALPYMEYYNISSVKGMYRGTLRNIGHCDTWDNFKQLGLFDQHKTWDFSVTPPAKVIAGLIKGDEKNIEESIAKFLNIPVYSIFIKKLGWLGLLKTKPFAGFKGRASAFDMLEYALEKKLVFKPGEVDLLVQHHEFVAKYPDKTEKITSTMVEKGIKEGDSAMSRTVGLPAAIATRMILEGKINLTGVLRPLVSEIYEPVLSELEKMGIKLEEIIS